MKLNFPDSPELFIQLLTDPKQWAAASWAATAFLYDPSAIPDPRVAPAIGLAFHNFAAGKEIFNRWHAHLAHDDTHEELRISIIEGPLPADPHGYSVFISSNPLNAIKRKQSEDRTFDPKQFIRFGQLNRMHPDPGSPHLRLFKQHFAAAKRYRLLPAHFDAGHIAALDPGRYIEKRELNLFHASDLKPHQAEYSVFSTPRDYT
jgi:hypothetical protein